MASSSAKPIGFQDINLDHFHFNMVMSKQKPLLRQPNLPSDKAKIIGLALVRTYCIPGKSRIPKIWISPEFGRPG